MFDFTVLEYFHFLRPKWFLVLIVFIWILVTFHKRSDLTARWKTVMSPNVLKALTIEGTAGRWFSPLRVSFVITVLVCLALMGPSWKQVDSPFNEDKTLLVIAVDVSDTMNQKDIQPSRLTRAKSKVLELLEMRGSSNTALIAYAGSAHTVMPITNDNELVRHFLDALKPEIMPVSGKRPELVVEKYRELLADKALISTLLLMGDGATESTAEAFAAAFSDSAQQNVIVWGIGTDGSEPDNAQLAEIVPLQKALLTSVADQAGGAYVQVTPDNNDVQKVNRRIEHNFTIVDDGSRPWLDSGYGLTFFIAALYLLWFRRGWTLQW